MSTATVQRSGQSSARSLEHKTFATEATILKSAEGDRVARFVVASDSLDRDGEVVVVKNMLLDDYRSNPVLLFGHDYRSLPCGKALQIGLSPDGRRLVADFLFADHAFAEDCWRLVKGGFLNSVSVGFRALAATPVPRELLAVRPELHTCSRIITASKLYEVSLVPIPSNPDALLQAVSQKSLRISSATLRAVVPNPVRRFFAFFSAASGISPERVDRMTIAEVARLCERLRLTAKDLGLEAFTGPNDKSEEMTECLKCGGSGKGPDGLQCSTCGGRGRHKVSAGNEELPTNPREPGEPPKPDPEAIAKVIARVVKQDKSFIRSVVQLETLPLFAALKDRLRPAPRRFTYRKPR